MPRHYHPASSSNSKSKSSSSGAMLYAVACGSQPGIYFHWKDSAELAIRGIANPVMEQFPSSTEATRYLESLGFQADDSVNGWHYRTRAPILFKSTTTTTMTPDPAASSSAAARMKSKNGKHDSTSLPNDPPSKKKKRLRTTTTTSTSTTSTGKTTSLGDTTTTLQLGGLSDTEDEANNNNDNQVVNDDADSHDSFMARAAPKPPLASRRRNYNKDDIDDDKAPAATTPPPPPLPEYKLDPCQQRAIDAAREGRNIFLTGVAGTGKSLVTKRIYEDALQRYRDPRQPVYLSNNNNNNNNNNNKTVALCAPTGMAAVGLGMNGQTIHTFAGVKVPFRASDFSTMFSRGNMAKWKTVQCLIMDEVGMLSADFLDWLDAHVRRVRDRLLEPFGGIQLIFVGDFAQLGPVPGNLSLNRRNGSGAVGPPYHPSHPGADCLLNIQEMTGFAFQTALWREANFCHVHLTQVYRQSDRTFVQALMDLRQQRPNTDLVQDFVQKCTTSLDYEERKLVFGEEAIQIPEGLLPTLLYTNNRNADRENAERLASLQTEHKRFVAEDSVHVAQNVADTPMAPRIQENLVKNKFFEQCQANKFLDLKVGAQVMLVQNFSTELELINGSRGVVEKFRLVPIVTRSDGTEERLLGPDDLDKFPPGLSFEQLKFGMTLRFEDMTWKITKFEKYPLVRFLNNRTKIILPSTFERTLFDQGTCRRKQLPLRLSWALTIHKAQGCTLDWLICDLAGCFTAGQAYVALSRAKTMAGLQIRNFSTKAVLTNPLVDRFYQSLKDDTIDDFLRNEAGLWWYPLLDHPEWLEMFIKADYNPRVQSNAEQFRMWVANYTPPSDYQGWKGYSDRTTTSCTPMIRPAPPPVRSPSFLDSKPIMQRRMVTPTTIFKPTTTLSQGGRKEHPIEL